ncbi:MAG: YkgJ family cysteine cluster protein [Deltaproteobacteria bacterium]|nr:YkgJ family cysteine cluster protein [Deltaproteobacteria bacterium]
MVVPTVPDDCTTCGCCCFSSEANYIRVFAADESRMDEPALDLTRVGPQPALDLTRVGPQGRAMRFTEGRCTALRIDGDPPRYRCRIYPARPDCCRWLQRGSGECLAQIAAKSEVRQAALPPKPR